MPDTLTLDRLRENKTGPACISFRQRGCLVTLHILMARARVIVFASKKYGAWKRDQSNRPGNGDMITSQQKAEST